MRRLVRFGAMRVILSSLTMGGVLWACNESGLPPNSPSIASLPIGQIPGPITDSSEYGGLCVTSGKILSIRDLQPADLQVERLLVSSDVQILTSRITSRGETLDLTATSIVEYEGVPGLTTVVPILSRGGADTVGMLFHVTDESGNEVAFTARPIADALEFSLVGGESFVLRISPDTTHMMAEFNEDVFRGGASLKVPVSWGCWARLVDCVKRVYPTKWYKWAYIAWKCVACYATPPVFPEVLKKAANCASCSVELAGPIVACIWVCCFEGSTK